MNSEFRTNGGTWVPEEWRTRLTATSGADGAWTLAGMPRTGIVSLALDGDRWVHDEQIVTLLDGNMLKAMHFTARPGAVLTGRVLTPEGTPAAGVRVGVSGDSRYASTNDVGKTSVEGRYRIAGLAPGAYYVNIARETQSWIAEPLTTEIMLTEGKETAAPDLRTRPGAVATGRILTPEGAPAANAGVRIMETNRSRRGRLMVLHGRGQMVVIVLPDWRRAVIPSRPPVRKQPGLPSRSKTSP